MMKTYCFGRTTAFAGALCLCAAASANWVEFVDETERRLTADPGLGIDDQEERDYAWGDLNNNGWVDLVVMRRNPNNSINAQQRNVLFMNEGGVLVDRTAEYASAVALDQLPDGATDEGFLTPVSDRMAAVVDVDDNGWLDVVTSPALNDGRPKHESHPRVYKNLGDSGGSWQGFEFQNARFPQLGGIVESGPWTGFAHAPRFNAVAAGDVTGDGFTDLYFSDFSTGSVCAGCPSSTFNFNDRLLINDGEGVFVDETTERLPADFTDSSYCMHSLIADLNKNEARDIAKVVHFSSFELNTRVIYNASLDGFFLPGDWQYVSQGGTFLTYVDAADLNDSGRLDLVIAQDATDRYLFNLSTDEDGMVNWSSSTSLPGSGGFRSNVVTADLSNNRFPDILVASVHPDLYGYNRLSGFYRNSADAPEVTFAWDSGNIPESPYLYGTFDFAVFDITGNGWNDIVIARRATSTQPGNGTYVLINQQAVCLGDLTGDENVGVDDLLALLAAWGDCPATDPCPEDLTGDGAVGVDDLLALLANWGLCP